jgi:hypothetical protein
MKYYISLNLNVFKEKESGAWENIPPLDLVTNEVVCDHCFEIFTQTIIAGTALSKDKVNESAAS